MNDSIFIKLGKKYNICYFYDVNTNEIVKINENLYNFLKKNLNCKSIQELFQCSDDDNIKCEIQELVEQGYLSFNHPCPDQHYLCDYIDIYNNYNLDRLTLQVTQNCNFKCRYCGYAGDGYLNRSHNFNTMSFDVACRAVDFFLEHSINSKALNIGFYGGEPLLEGRLIRQVIEYITSKNLGKKISYRITTNGSIVDFSLFEYLSQHDVYLMVSFDGPEKIHNKNRRFAINGEGTFETVEKNLEKIKSLFPKLFSKLTLHSVIDPSESYTKYKEFFSKNEFFVSQNYSTSLIDDSKTLFKKKYDPDFLRYDAIEELMYYYHIITNSPALDKPIYVHSYQKDPILKKFERTEPLSRNFHHSGPCIPGVTRLFVDVRGTIYPCEKISELSECMKIGNVYTGFDKDKVLAQLNIVNMCKKDCSNCWAIRHCTICCNQIDNVDSFSYKIKKQLCKANQESLIRDFEKYILLKEML